MKIIKSTGTHSQYQLKLNQQQNVRKAVPSVERLPGKHQEGIGSFREDNDFADVTIAYEDGQQVEAHKVILAASSFFSRSCLEGTSTHLFIKRRLKSEDLLAVLHDNTLYTNLAQLVGSEPTLQKGN